MQKHFIVNGAKREGNTHDKASKRRENVFQQSRRHCGPEENEY